MKGADSQIGVLVVDDHALLRDGLAAMLAGEPDMRLLGEAAHGAEAIARYQALRPDVVLMDLQMPGIDGVEATRRIRLLDPAARIIVLTTYAGDVRALAALQAGASAYLLKEMLRHEVVQAVRDVHAGRRHAIPPVIAQSIVHHVASSALSGREIEVLGNVAAGLSNKMIADRMAISEQTVKGHLKNILDKLHARDRTHAVTLALRRGIISLER